MKRAKTTKPAATRTVQSRTGRDGAIDHLLKMEEPAETQPARGDHTYRVIELVGTSDDSIEDAIDAAVARAHKTLRNLRWFEIVRTTGQIENGRVRYFQVTLKVGFTMEDVR